MSTFESETDTATTTGVLTFVTGTGILTVTTTKASTFADEDWVEVTARVNIEYWKDYDGEGPVLYASDIHRVKKPGNDIISFV